MQLMVHLHRGFRRPGFRYSLLVSLFIACLAIWGMGLKISSPAGFLRYQAMGPASRWLGLIQNAGAVVIVLLYPLLASLAYGEVFWEKRHYGIQSMELSRESQRRYYRSHFIAGFLLGGCSGTAALAFNFVLLFMFLPAIPVNQFFSDPIVGYVHSFSKLYVQSSYLYVLVRLALLFLWSGLITVFTMALSMHIKARYVPLIIPTLFLLFYDLIVSNILGISKGVGQQFVFGMRFDGYTWIVILGMIVISLALYLIGVRKYEKFEA